MRTLDWVGSTKPTLLLSLFLLATGLAMAAGLLSSPTLIGKSLHVEALHGHQAIAMWILPLFFLQGFEDPRWGSALSFAVVVWLLLLVAAAILSRSVSGQAATAIRIGLSAWPVCFSILRLLAASPNHGLRAKLDAACLLAIGLAFAGVGAWILPLFVALGSISRAGDGAISKTLLAAAACLAFRSLVALGFDLAWFGVLFAGVAVCLVAIAASAAKALWERLLTAFQAVVLIQAIGLAFLLGVVEEPFVSDTLAASSLMHLFLLVPLLGWLRDRRAPTTNSAWIGLGLAAIGYHTFVWAHFLLGRSGMPRMYFGYTDEFQTLFVIAAIGALMTASGVVLFFLTRHNSQVRLPEAVPLAPT